MPYSAENSCFPTQHCGGGGGRDEGKDGLRAGLFVQGPSLLTYFSITPQISPLLP